MPLREGAWQMPSTTKNLPVPWLWKISSRFTIATVGLFSKFWLVWLNKVKVHNREVLVDLLNKRPQGQGLLTISNHVSCIDDPLIWAHLETKYFTPQKMRLTSAASDVCFTKDIYAKFFSRGQVFPVVRGDGVYQKGMDFMVEQLDLGRWCHHFPEGKINATHEYLRLKWGVGRLISDTQRTPLVLPIWHVGMDSILPNKKPYIPQIKKKLTILIGQPLDFTSEVEVLKSLKKTPMEIRKHITDLLQADFLRLRELAEGLHKEITSS